MDHIKILQPVMFKIEQTLSQYKIEFDIHA